MAKRKPSRSGVSLNQPLSDQPWWVKTIVWVGVPTAAMGYLLYFVIGSLSARLDHISSSMDRHQGDMASLIQHLQEDTSRGWALVSVSQRICLNTAKTEPDKLQCVISMTKGQQP